ncbi:MAG: hypothetical protein Q9220_005231 [cf. Caloplaca sp. 1 TL-2023]
MDADPDDIPLVPKFSCDRIRERLIGSSAHHLPSSSNNQPVVKLASRDTPPPLHFSPVTSEQERSSTAETTPIATPKTSFDNSFARRSDKEIHSGRDLLFSHYRRGPGFAGSTTSYVDSALLESDTEDSPFPLFQDISEPDHDMDNGAPLMDTTSSYSRFPPSHRRQKSNLTSALKSTSGNETRGTPAMSVINGKGAQGGLPHRDSLNGGQAGSSSLYGSGAQPITMSNSSRERPRRESLAGSMVSGMSWGGVSVGSWVRDEIINQGSSPFPQQSPSYHSSSYIPKMEANYMTDFNCCGKNIASFHLLVQHYEENHAASVPRRISGKPTAPRPDSKAAIAANTAHAVRQSAKRQQYDQHTKLTQANLKTAQVQSSPTSPKVDKAQPTTTGGHTASQHHPSLDMDAVQDMEMDDVDYDPVPKSTTDDNWGMPTHSRILPRSQFSQPGASQVPQLDIDTLNLGNRLQQHQGLRNSTPTTPVTATRNGNPYHNNPTVSSVNTPTLTAYPVQQQAQYMKTPDSSAPGTPGDINMADPLGDPTTMNNDQEFGRNHYAGYNGFQFGNGNDMIGLCIDEPAKRLYSPNGLYSNNGNKDQAAANAAKLGDAQYSENSDIARVIREQQRLVGIPDGGSGPSDGVPKPFHCPVIGCEKAYKNQNGLKYHKSQLKSNENGTFSIVDPDTLQPYVGTLGMEKHKPYRCVPCGKRYKNLNGLKYHKSHTPACEDGKPPASPIRPTSSSQANAPRSSIAPNSNQAGSMVAADVPGVSIPAGLDMTTSTGFPGTSLTGIDEDMVM